MAFIVQSILGIIFIIAFGWIRDDLIIYRTRLVHPNCAAVRPPKLPVGQPFYRRIFSWIPAVLKIRQSELLATAGLDALMFDKLISWGIFFFGPLVVLGIGVVLPVNYFGGVITHGKDPDNVVDEDFSLEFTRMTMGNVEQNSGLLFVHFFATYVVIGWAAYTLYLRCRQYSLLKREYMGSISTAAQWQGEFQDPLYHNVKMIVGGPGAAEPEDGDMKRSSSADDLSRPATPRARADDSKGTVELQPVGGSNFQGFSTPGSSSETTKKRGPRRGSIDDLNAQGRGAARNDRSDVHFEPRLKWHGGPEMWLKDVPMTARDLMNPLNSDTLEAAAMSAAADAAADGRGEDLEAQLEPKEEDPPAGAAAHAAAAVAAPEPAKGAAADNAPAAAAAGTVEDSVNFDEKPGTKYKYAAPAHQYAVLLRDVPLPPREGSQRGNKKQLFLVPTAPPGDADERGAPGAAAPATPGTSSVVVTDDSRPAPANGTMIAERDAPADTAEFQQRRNLESAKDEVEMVFGTLFPHSFSKVIPVRNHKQTDLLLEQWDRHYRELEEARAQFQNSGKEPYLACLRDRWCCFGRRIRKIEYHTRLVQELERKILQAQKSAPYTSSYFVVFNSQLSATIASQVFVRNVDSGRQWTTETSPGARRARGVRPSRGESLLRPFEPPGSG